MSGRSTISVIIPTYNSAGYVCEAVESALAQTWSDTEIIVIDDGSTDDTSNRLDTYLDRIHYEYQPNRGRSSARNRGIELATGEWIAFLDADDIWYPDKLERQMASLFEYPTADWAYCNVDVVVEDGSPLESDFWETTFGSGQAGLARIYDALLESECVISTSTVLVRSALVRRLGGFDEELPSAEDTHLWRRLAKVSGVVYLAEELGTMRIDTRILLRDRMAGYGAAQTSRSLAQKSVDEDSLAVSRPQLARRLLYRSYVQSALLQTSRGDVQAVAGLLAHARSLYDGPSFYRDLAAQMACFSLTAARYSKAGPLSAQEILSDIDEAIPLQMRTKLVVTQAARSQLFAAVSHMYAQKGDGARMALYARKALLHDPRQWTNIGLWKRAVRCA